MNPVIYVVATPIGNLDDLSSRAIRVLQEVDLIAAEDTRRARQLLSHLGIQKKEVVSYYDQVEVSKAASLIERLEQQSQSMALISDAGTPGISDPGYRLIKLAHEREIKVHPIPGPSALTALVSASGLPNDRLLFVGFLPPKSKALKDELASWRPTRASILFFEATRRLEKTLRAVKEVYPEAQVCIGRELTKMYEDIITGSIDQVLEAVASQTNFKGEAVVMLWLGNHSCANVDITQLTDSLRADLQAGKSFRDILIAYKDLGIPKSELYQKLLEIKEDL